MVPRPPRREAFVVAAKFVLLCGLLFGPWPGLGQATCITFCIAATPLVEALATDTDLSVRFELVDAADTTETAERGWTVKLVAVHSGSGQASEFPLGLRLIAYYPLALFVALALSAPLEDRRRASVLLLGLAALAARLALAVALPAGSFLGAFDREGVVQRVAQIFFRSFIEPPNLIFATPVLVFALALLVTNPRPLAPLARTGAAGRVA
jgi:hypothetical protein